MYYDKTLNIINIKIRNKRKTNKSSITSKYSK